MLEKAAQETAKYLSVSRRPRWNLELAGDATGHRPQGVTPLAQPTTTKRLALCSVARHVTLSTSLGLPPLGFLFLPAQRRHCHQSFRHCHRNVVAQMADAIWEVHYCTTNSNNSKPGWKSRSINLVDFRPEMPGKATAFGIAL